METFSFCFCARSSSTPCTVTSLASTLCRQMTSSVSAGASSKSSASLRLSSLLLLPTRTSRYSVQVFWHVAKYSVLRNHVEEDVSFSARYPGCLWWIGERNQHVIVLVENVYSGIRWILHTNCIKCPVSDQQNPKCSKKYRQRSRCRYWPCICVWSDQYHSNSHWSCESHFSLYLTS